MKKLIYALLFMPFLSLAQVKVIAPIEPNNTADTYPTHTDIYGKGGLQSVATTTLRDAITTERRKEGMMVFVTADQKIYQLKGGTANANWVEFSSAASSLTGITQNRIPYGNSTGGLTSNSGLTINPTTNIITTSGYTATAAFLADQTVAGTASNSISPLNITGGNGMGIAGGSNFTSNATAGNSASILLKSGSGGSINATNTAMNTGGQALGIQIESGLGGNATNTGSGGQVGGAGGSVNFGSGRGGHASSNSAITGVGGNGGNIGFTAGVGGNSRASTVSTSGNGGDIVFQAGNAGTILSGSSPVYGRGGNIVLTTGLKESDGGGVNGKIILSQRPEPPAGEFEYLVRNIANGETNAMWGSKIAPESATAPGIKGEIRFDGTHIYWCYATDSWLRVAGSTW